MGLGWRFGRSDGISLKCCPCAAAPPPAGLCEWCESDKPTYIMTVTGLLPGQSLCTPADVNGVPHVADQNAGNPCSWGYSGSLVCRVSGVSVFQFETFTRYGVTFRNARQTSAYTLTWTVDSPSPRDCTQVVTLNGADAVKGFEWNGAEDPFDVDNAVFEFVPA